MVQHRGVVQQHCELQPWCCTLVLCLNDALIIQRLQRGYETAISNLNWLFVFDNVYLTLCMHSQCALQTISAVDSRAHFACIAADLMQCTTVQHESTQSRNPKLSSLWWNDKTEWQNLVALAVWSGAYTCNDGLLHWRTAVFIPTTVSMCVLKAYKDLRITSLIIAYLKRR